MDKELELLIRKNALKDVELWLYKQYAEIEKELMSFTEDRNDDSAKEEEMIIKGIEAEIARGDVVAFNSVDEFLTDLEEE